MELKIGDTIYCDSRINGLSKLKVTRETATSYVLGEHTKVKKPFVDGCAAKGASSFPEAYYWLPDEIMDAKYQRKLNERFVGCFGWAKLSNENYQLIVDFLKTLT